MTTIRLITPAELKALRAELGLSQSGFAARYAIPLSSLCNWEQGRRQPDAMSNLALQLVRLDPVRVAALIGRLRLEHAWAGDAGR